MDNKDGDLTELAHLLNYSIRRFGEFLIESANELQETLEAPDEEIVSEDNETDEDYPVVSSGVNGIAERSNATISAAIFGNRPE